MARPVRMDYPNTFYRVLSGGNERRNIFRDAQDYERFTDTVRRVVERFGLVVPCLCFDEQPLPYSDSYPGGESVRGHAMVGMTYSMWFNRRHMRSGHLFQGRFKSFVIEKDRYFTSMCLYIHRNPVRARVVENLLDYPWSSYPTYVAARRKEPWLTTSLVLGMYGGSRKKFIDAQLAYAGKEKSLLDELRYGLFLGSERFAQDDQGQGYTFDRVVRGAALRRIL